MKIGVFCSANDNIDAIFFKETEQLALWAAQNGHDIVCGGCNMGLMECVARTAKKAGGRTIGIVPVIVEERGRVSDWIDIHIPCVDLNDRKQLMMEWSDVFVALPGGIGTYEELFEMLTLKQLGRTDRAIVLLNTEGYFEPLFELLRHTAKERFMSHRCLELFSVAETPEEALSQLDAYTPTKGSLRRLADYNKD